MDKKEAIKILRSMRENALRQERIYSRLGQVGLSATIKKEAEACEFAIGELGKKKMRNDFEKFADSFYQNTDIWILVLFLVAVVLLVAEVLL